METAAAKQVMLAIDSKKQKLPVLGRGEIPDN